MIFDGSDIIGGVDLQFQLDHESQLGLIIAAMHITIMPHV